MLFMGNFVSWFSVVTFIISIALLVWDFWQLASRKKEREIHKAQVKIWQHYASGINHALLTLGQNIEQGKYTSPKDVEQSVKLLQPVTYSLFTSLNEERLFTEEEIKERQLENEKQIKELLNPTASK